MVLSGMLLLYLQGGDKEKQVSLKSEESGRYDTEI